MIIGVFSFSIVTSALSVALEETRAGNSFTALELAQAADRQVCTAAIYAHFPALAGSGLSLRLEDDISKCVSALREGEVMAVVYDRPTLARMKVVDGAGSFDIAEMITDIDLTIVFPDVAAPHFFESHDINRVASMRSFLNEAILEAEKAGRLSELADKWFPASHSSTASQLSEGYNVPLLATLGASIAAFTVVRIVLRYRRKRAAGQRRMLSRGSTMMMNSSSSSVLSAARKLKKWKGRNTSSNSALGAMMVEMLQEMQSQRKIIDRMAERAADFPTKAESVVEYEPSMVAVVRGRPTGDASDATAHQDVDVPGVVRDESSRGDGVKTTKAGELRAAVHDSPVR